MSKVALSVLQITDLHILPESENTLLGIKTEHYFHAVLNLAFANHNQYDLIIVTGDLAQEPCLSSYQRIRDRLTQTNVPSICLSGNHDDYELMNQVFNNDFVNCEKQVLVNEWQIISLNSQVIGASSGYIDKPELAFLKTCLKQYPNTHTLIAIHHHFIPSHSPWLDTMIIKNADEFIETIKQHPQVKLVTTGHVHQEIDSYEGHQRILGTPSTCFQFMPLSASFSIDSKMPGYRHITLYENGTIDTQVYRIEGALHELDANALGY